MLIFLFCFSGFANAIFSDRRLFPYHRNFYANVRRVYGIKTKSANSEFAQIICTENSIGIEFPFGTFTGGRLFASKFDENPECVVHVSLSTNKAIFKLPLNRLPCGIKTKTINYPNPGIEYTLNVVASFNDTKMTEADEIFALSCRNFPKKNAVGAIMQVSPYSKTYLIGNDNTPNCRYSLRVNSLDGPPADNAQFGDRVFHVWECATQNYAVKVYECYVHDGANRRYMLIDENGCSKDKSIMPELNYDPNLNLIYASSPVFKFLDSNKMFFNCLLYMCPKNDSKCRETVPPNCGIRSKRFSSLRNGIHQFIRNSSFQDLSRDQIILRDDPMDPEGLFHPIEPPLQPIIHYKPSESKTCSEDGYSQTAFIILIFCNLITLIIATISLWTLYHRRFSAKLSISDRN